MRSLAPSTRRRFLAVLGAAGTGGPAGCTGSLPSGSSRCPAYEAPRWQIDGRLWSPPVVDDGDVLVTTEAGTAARRRDGRE